MTQGLFVCRRGGAGRDLPETKVTDELFPRAALRAMGYLHLLVHG